MAEHETVCVSASEADFGSPMQSEGERCPSLTHSPILALSDVVLRADSSSVSTPWEIQIRRDLLSQLQAGSGILSQRSESCEYGPYRVKGLDI